MRKVIVSLAPVQAGTPVDAVKLAEDVEKKRTCGGGHVPPALQKTGREPEPGD